MKKKIGYFMLILGMVLAAGFVGGMETGQTDLLHGMIYMTGSVLMAIVGGKISGAIL